MAVNSALLIIDVQNAMFLPDNPVFNGDNLLDKIGKLADKFRSWNIPVIYVQHTSETNDKFKRGSYGWTVNSVINPVDGDLKAMKTNPDSFFKSELKEILDSHGVKNLFVCGIQTELCVDTTCRSAASKGYNVTLIEDAHSTFSGRIISPQEIINYHNQILKGWFVKLTDSSSILSAPDPSILS